MFVELNRNLFSVRTVQKFIAYVFISCAIALLLATSADSKTSNIYSQIKGNHSRELVEIANHRTSFDTTQKNQHNNYKVGKIFSSKEQYSTNSFSSDIARVKNFIKVTHDDSDCAKELLIVLSRYMNVANIYATWSYGDNDYVYEVGSSSNYRSLNKNLAIKSKALNSNILLASTEHQQTNEQMIDEVQSTFRSHGVQINELQANGNYKSDGSPCTVSFPCNSNSYCVKQPPN